MDSLNDIWTAWNQEWGTTVAMLTAAAALISNFWQKLQKGVSNVKNWKIWKAISNISKKVIRTYRLHRAEGIMRQALGEHGVFVPIATYGNCLQKRSDLATKEQLGAITPAKPSWLNDYYAATALERLSKKGRILKATQYDQSGFPPRPQIYSFRNPITGASLQEQAEEIQTNSKCAIYQNFQMCQEASRFHREGYRKTISPRETRTGSYTSLKENAPPCEECWQKQQRESDLQNLVNNIMRNEFAAQATRELTGDNGEFQEAVTEVCKHCQCPAEVTTVLEIVEHALEIRRNQIETALPSTRNEWPDHLREDFTSRLTNWVKSQPSWC